MGIDIQTYRENPPLLSSSVRNGDKQRLGLGVVVLCLRQWVFSFTPYKGSTFFIPFSQMRQLRLRDVGYLCKLRG